MDKPQTGDKFVRTKQRPEWYALAVIIQPDGFNEPLVRYWNGKTNPWYDTFDGNKKIHFGLTKSSSKLKKLDIHSAIKLQREYLKREPRFIVVKISTEVRQTTEVLVY